MPQHSTIEAVNTIGAPPVRQAAQADRALVMIECPADKRQEMYRALADLPCRVVLIEEPSPPSNT